MTIARFSNAAKLTQAKYGYKRYEAFFEIGKNFLIVQKIATHKARILIKAKRGFFARKKLSTKLSLKKVE